MGHCDHKEHAQKSVRCFIVTVSDTRTPEDDESGLIIRMGLEGKGHSVLGVRIVKDDPAEIKAALISLPAETEAVIFNGGTGISRRDCTYDVLAASLEKTLPGFGELFRALSYQEIGSAAMMSRATAGVIGSRVVISIPGSANAVRLAVEKLISPELAHMVWETNR
ncbi:MAG: molybdenum cofactor biosynthesis protein B [bacterium]